MVEVKGKYNTAKVFTDNLEESGREQIERLCDQPYAADSKIRMMPDVHAGAGCTIGTTMTIADKICPNLVGVDIGCGMETLIDTDAMILRKGSVSARKGEKLLIPINMRDGSLVCVGKGNEDWNYSAPHGAGRVMGRKEARYKLKLEDFEKSMEGIWSSTVCQDTLDEAPMAYKDMSEIIANIEPTAEVVNIIKPIFNFKAAEDYI